MSISIDDFAERLSSLGLVTSAEAESLVIGIPPASRKQDAEEFARGLVRQGKLTRYQAAAIYQNKADTLVLGNYLILDKLGAGGMGQVFRARHRRMERVVALKVLSKKAFSPTAVARFQREVKAAARLTHPNIVTAHDADEADGMHFLVMELVEGNDLANLVKVQGPLPLAQALDCILQAACGLEHAHGEGIIHRDIKPSNLLLDKKGTVKILDMGLALVSDPLADAGAVRGADLTQSGSIMGTVDYMAPEQAMDCRQADARSDIYSLGCTLHYLLTGRPPYSGDTVLKRLTAHQQAAIPLLSATRPDIPPGLDEVFGRMMAKRPAARFQTSQELVAALDALRNQAAAAQPLSVTAQPATAVAVPATPTPSGVQDLESIVLPGVDRTSRKPGKASSKMPLVMAAVVLLLATAGAGAWVMSGQRADEEAQGEPASIVESPAADPQPAVPPSKETTPPEFSPAEPTPPIATVPEAMPAKVEPPPKAASPAPPVAAPVVPAVPSAKPVPPSPPVVAPIVSVASAPLPAAADAKAPIPGTEGQREAIKLIQELYKEDYARAKQPDTKAALAEKLLNESRQIKDDTTALYVMLREARDMAIEAANPALAERAISMLAGRFAVDPLKELATALDEMVGKPHPSEANSALAESALVRIDEALMTDDFDTAKKLANVAVVAGRKAKDAILLKRTVEEAKKVVSSKQQWEAGQKARTILTQKPDDPTANFALGRYLCFIKGDWEHGLAHLAKGSDCPLKELAVKSTKSSTQAHALAELGDAWFIAAEKAKGKDKTDLRAGAAYWYSQAEPDLTGLVKAKIEKRLTDLGRKVAVMQSTSTGQLPETMELPLASRVSIRFRLIPAGRFIMGTPSQTGAELPHQVNISQSFYLGATEITQAQWLAVMDNNPSAFASHLERPVEQVSWNDCQVFLDRLNQGPTAQRFHYRLPTEAEWEYACRAGTTTTHYFGKDATLLPQYAWFKDNSQATTQPISQLKPNPLGLYDMYGNVWEWCSDSYADEHEAALSRLDLPSSGSERSIRGGSWGNVAAVLRSARRDHQPAEYRNQTIGFRLACQLRQNK